MARQSEKLTPKQERMLLALLRHGGRQEAAEKAGVSRRTLQRHLADPVFAEAYRQARQQLRKGAAIAFRQNIKLPGDGTYTFRVHVDKPTFPRHDRKNGRRYTQPVVAMFEHRLKLGQS